MNEEYYPMEPIFLYSVYYSYPITINPNYGNPIHKRIGCGLAGGTWDKIEPGIREELTALGVKTMVYEFE